MKRLERTLSRADAEALAGPLAARGGLGGPDAGHPGRLRAGRRPPDLEPAPGRLQRGRARASRATIAAQTRLGIDARGRGAIPRSQPRAAWRSLDERRRSRSSTANGHRPRGAPPRRSRPRAARRRSACIEVGDLAVASADRIPDVRDPEPLFVQYARSTDSLDGTISKLWLFLGRGRARRHDPGGAGRHRGRRPRDAPDRRR